MSRNLRIRQVSGHTPRIAAIAERQYDLITFAQLLEAGLTDGGISHRVRRGALRRVHRGVYALGHAPLSREAAWLAAVLACHGRRALGSLPAAELHRISRFRAPCPVVLTTRKRTLDGVKVQRCRTLDRRDVTTLRGIPVTTIHRTFIDASDVLTPHQVANLIHEAAFRGRFVEPAVRDAMARANGRRSLPVLNRAIELHKAGSAGTRSGSEDAFLTFDLPEPVVNTDLYGFEVDFQWPGTFVVVEIDGPGHARAHARRTDPHRDEYLSGLGYTILRFTPDDVAQRPGFVRDRTALALG